MLDWNDLRYFLAVADTGSTLAAGKKLKVSQTTAARRIAALEESLGLTLFERRQAGYALTPAGEADVAVRASVMPQGGRLVVRRIGPDPWTLYCALVGLTWQAA